MDKSTHPASTDANLALLRATVEAKMRYWDAVLVLENALSGGAELPDKASNALTDAIDNLAAGLDEPETAKSLVIMEHLDGVIKNVCPAPARPPTRRRP